MPATYTYNDALTDAKAVILKAFEEADALKLPSNVDLLLDIGGRLTALKRPSRRKRERAPARGLATNLRGGNDLSGGAR